MPVTSDPLFGITLQSALQLNGAGDYVSFNRGLISISGSSSGAVIFWAPRSTPWIFELLSQAGGYGTPFYLGCGPDGRVWAGDGWGRAPTVFPQTTTGTRWC